MLRLPAPIMRHGLSTPGLSQRLRTDTVRISSGEFGPPQSVNETCRMLPSTDCI